MLARLVRLLATSVTRRPRLFLTLRRGRSETGLFRSRRLGPNPSPRPRAGRPWRRPAVPAQPQPSSPTRREIRLSRLWPARTPSGGSGWPETAPPSLPTNVRPPARRAAQHPAQASPSRAPLPARATPRSVRRRAGPGASPRFSQKTPRRASRVFWKKTLTRANPPPVAPTIRSCPHPTGPTRGVPRPGHRHRPCPAGCLWCRRLGRRLRLGLAGHPPPHPGHLRPPLRPPAGACARPPRRPALPAATPRRNARRSPPAPAPGRHAAPGHGSCLRRAATPRRQWRRPPPSAETSFWRRASS